MKCAIDLDDIIQTVKPWELTIKIDGTWFRVRRLTNADMKRLSDANKYSDSENRHFISCLFEGAPPPHVSEWDAARLSGVMGIIGAYYNQAAILPNLEAATKAVAAQIQLNGSPR